MKKEKKQIVLNGSLLRLLGEVRFCTPEETSTTLRVWWRFWRSRRIASVLKRRTPTTICPCPLFRWRLSVRSL